MSEVAPNISAAVAKLAAAAVESGWGLVVVGMMSSPE
jgi:hypothetical protein